MSRRPDKDKKRARPPEPADDDLPMLESIAEELEQVAAQDLVKVACGTATEPGFDVDVTVEVPAMDKAKMPDAVRGPLQRAAAAHAAQLRNHRVVVRFLGDTLIGTAVKTVIGEVLVAARARRIVARRGYGDEVLHDAPPPRVEVTKATADDGVRIEVATGELEAADLPMAMQQEIVALASNARGQRLQFVFRGAARPDGVLRDLLARALGDAGALRVAIGERVLFDRELESRVTVSPRGDEVAVEVTPADTEDATLQALSMVLPPAAERLAGKVVSLQFRAPPRPAERDHAVQLCQQAGPRRLEVATATGVDVVLPMLLESEADGERTTVRVLAGGRDRAGVQTAIARELAPLSATLALRDVRLDFTADPVFDDELVAATLRQVVTLGPRTLTCSRDGGEAEPILPAPLTFGEGDGAHVVRIDTDAGKPAQLLAVVERRLAPAAAGWRGRGARIEFVGASAPSRTLVRTAVALVEAAGVERLAVVDHGAVDIVRPPLLHVRGTGGDLRVGAEPGGRNDEQIERALQRELAGLDWRGANVAIAPLPFAERLIKAAIELGAARVMLEGDVRVQVHPRLLAAEVAGRRLVLRATPDGHDAMIDRQIARELPPALALGGDLAATDVVVAWAGAGDGTGGPVATLLAAVIAAGPARVLLDSGDGPRQVHPVVVREFVRLLGRNDGARPMLMLGLVAGDEADRLPTIVERLRAMADELRDRRVLLVVQVGERDRVAPTEYPLVAAARTVVDELAAATLLFRGPDAHGRTHFAVVHSRDAALAVGALFGDPRARR